ncbi:MAG: nucleotide exchange factor GrpE [Paludibacteraceae bacterium]|nr:nucleotide exchange factor GrpE [Paludibacteraceae bacterium]
MKNEKDIQNDELLNEENVVEEVQTEAPEAANEDSSESVQPSAEELLEKANAEILDLRDKNLRMMAEFDNFRRRTAKEKLELQKTAGERIFVDMLSLVDDFERAEKAMSTCEDVEALRQGLDLIHKKFVAFLEKNDVKAIETEDADFNVDLHEAITTFPAGEDKKGKIIDCTQRGYTLGEKVIRYAKVVVGE